MRRSQPLPHRICYAVKANGNLAMLNLFASLGAGFDIVSGGELERVIRAGGDPANVIFSGVGKSGAEIDFALKLDIGSSTSRAAAELDRLELHAQRLREDARISVRVNPDIDAGTHPYISTGLKSNKFGVPRDEALAMYRHAANSQWLDVDRHRLPHRFADRDAGAAASRRCIVCSRSSTRSNAKESASSISISAAVSASPTATSRNSI